jgi:hypothetical protein
MKLKTRLKPFATLILLSSLATAQAQDKGYWRAASNTARSITGDLSLGDEKIIINFVGFPMVKSRTLEKDEVSALFDVDSNTPGIGTLYHLTVPAAKKFLNKNTLCGGEDTQWMVTYAYARSLRVALFSGQKAPVFTFNAISNSTDLCGTFEYAR